MRFVLAAALLLVAASVLPSIAQAGTIVGKFECLQILPCNQADPAFPAVNQLIDMTNACLARNTGMSSGGGSFDKSAGLDSNGCLTADMGQITNPKQTVPQCCIQQMQSGSCMMHCDFVTQ